MILFRKIFIVILLICIGAMAQAQVITDSTVKVVADSGRLVDTIVKDAPPKLLFQETDSVEFKDPRARSPRKAALRSAILPGWGQVYNKKLWKVPIVYAALGITGGVFVSNLQEYKMIREAIIIYYNMNPTTPGAAVDSTGYNGLENRFKNIINRGGINQLTNARKEVRKAVDYSAVYFVVGWLLNVVDAAVDAHLSTFDISPNLSFKLQPGYSDLARTNGVSLVLRFK